MKNTKQLLDYIVKTQKNLCSDCNDIAFIIQAEDLKEMENKEDLILFFKKLNEKRDYCITQVDVNFCYTAIEYLRKNDQSLEESLKIAHELGLTIDKLNSEVLASLLATRNNEDDYSSFLGTLIEHIEDFEDTYFSN